MKIKMLVSRSGPAGVQNAGDIVEVPSDEGQRMIDAGQCEIVRSAKMPEKAITRSKAERASR